MGSPRTSTPPPTHPTNPQPHAQRKLTRQLLRDIPPNALKPSQHPAPEPPVNTLLVFPYSIIPQPIRVSAKPGAIQTTDGCQKWFIHPERHERKGPLNWDYKWF